jgi:FKBP-type peptidyl-prolyl cis-trans isomerase
MKLLHLVILLFLTACTSKGSSPKDVKWNKEKSIELSRSVAIKEKLAIKMYLVHRPSLKMEETGTGLNYYIYKKTNSPKAVSGREAGITYTISFLNGAKCYNVDSTSIEFHKIDHSELETGLQEGLKKMRLGEKAIFIIPSHLAHGLTGDQYKIPPLTPLVIDVTLKELR